MPRINQRFLCYLSSRYTGELENIDKQRTRGHEAKYSALYPVHGINILDYLEFPYDEDALRTYCLYDKVHNDYYGKRAKQIGKKGLLTLTFLELKKQNLDNNQVNIKHWMDFFLGIAD